MGNVPPASTPRSRLFYGWYIAWAGAGTNFLFGITSYGFGVFIQEFRHDFGWSVKAIALGFSIISVQVGFLSPFTGFFLDRVGPRKMAVTGVVIVAVALFAMSRMHSLWLYYVCLLLIALGQSLGGFGAFNTVLVRWFQQKRGRALAVMSVGIGAGYFTALILATLIGWVGWRETMVIASASILVLGVPLALVIRDHPEDLGYSPDGTTPRLPIPDAAARRAGRVSRDLLATGMDVGQSLKVPAFYLLGLASIAGQVTQGAFITFQIPHLQNEGFSRGAAGLFVAAYGVAQIAARFLAGWVGDSLGRRRVYVAGFGFMALGMIAFAFVTPGRFWLIPVVIVIYGLGNAAWIIGASTTPAEYFGTKRFATIRGLMQTMTVPITLAVPLFMGSTFDRLGSYQFAYFILAFGSLSGALWMLLVRRKPWEQTQSPALSPAAVPAPAAAVDRR